MQLLTSYKENHKHLVESVVEQTLDAGCKSIQFCWGNCTDLEYFKTAEKIKKLTEKYNAELVVNNRIDVALAIQADCIHLGKNDVPIDIARDIIPRNMKIGYTIDNLNQLKECTFKHADYIGAGVIFSTRTKNHFEEPIGLNGLFQIKTETGMDVVAIGGITVDNVLSVKQHGANKVAVIGAIYDSQNISKTVQKLIS